MPLTPIRDTLFEDLMTRLRPRLSVGAADFLRDRRDKPEFRKADPVEEVGSLVDFLTEPNSAYLFQPGKAIAPGDDPLRVALGLCNVSSATADTLAREWRVELLRARPRRNGEWTPPTLSELVMDLLRRLGRPENRGLLATPPPPPAYENALAVVMRESFPQEIPAGRVEELARAWGPETVSMHDSYMLVRFVAMRLQAAASVYGLGQLKASDPRLGGRMASANPTPERERSLYGSNPL